MNQKGFANIVLIFVVIAIVAIGGYFIFSKKSVIPTETQQPTPVSNEVKAPTFTQTATEPSQKATSSPTSPTIKTDDWKTYRSEKYGFEFRYPATWKVVELYGSSVQVQEIKNGEVVGIAGVISAISKPPLSPIDYPYEKMFTSNAYCPSVAGSRDFGDAVYVYCLTGKETKTTAGTWKSVVETSASVWYGMNEQANPSTPPNEFWIDTKDFFYVVHFNFFESIENNSEKTVFFDKFLKGFSFF